MQGIFRHLVMKYLNIIVGLFIVACSHGQSRHALVVAVSRYSDPCWNEIHANNDLSVLLPVLAKQGFTVTRLVNESATKKNITEALLTLKNRARKGDLVYIHFSCHGQQMADNNGDEPDGLDEAIIPYDAAMHYEKGKYEGENHLRDDELGEYLVDIRKAIGDKGNLLITIDACHSASMTRDPDDEEYIRGTTGIFAERPVDNRLYANAPYIEQSLLQQDGLSPVTIMSACRANQNNYEYKAGDKFYGALTYALCDTLLDTDITNSIMVMTKVKEMMKKTARRQNPVFESTLTENESSGE